MELEVIILLLMSKEEFLITPFGLVELAIKLELTNENLMTSHLFWFVPSIDIVQVGIGRDVFKLVKVGHVSFIALWEQIVHVFVWLESQSERNLQVILTAVFTVHGHV